jgi:hypothetical protein
MVWIGRKGESTPRGFVTELKMIRLEKALLLVWFAANLVIGALTVHEYGMSIDEPNNFQYAAATLRSYPSFFGTLYTPPYNSSFDGHGPAFITVAAIVIGVIQRIDPNAFTLDLWHFSYFVTFQLTGLCLYWLTKRWFSKWTAWSILILFSTQPLLLGHAFINPKDIPFMFLLTLSIVAGFRLVDSVEAKESFLSLEKPARTLINKFKEAEPRRRRKFILYSTVTLAILISLFIFSHQINSLIEQIVTFFYAAKSDSWAGQIFNSIGSHTSHISVEDYVIKAVRLFRRLKRYLLTASGLFFLAYFYLLIKNTTLPAFLRNAWKQGYIPANFIRHLVQSLRNSLNWHSIKVWFGEFLRSLVNRRVILAGVALGLATAVRAIAPFVGLIVFLYLFSKVRSRVWTTTIAYFLVAGIVTYLTWPHLWGAPIQRYWEGLGIISNFPYPGRVLFAGHLYSASALPREYLPVLLSIQFTEPFILCAYLGLGLLVWQILHDQLRADLLLYIGLGFVFPLLGLILLDSPLYHNFRQALFLVPAMFILAALPLEMVFRKLTQSWARILLIVAIALPGVYSSAKLYPYEYVYYNALAGGLAGARDRYELDYWRISLREMALEMNKIAPPGAKIIVTRSAGLFARYARADLVVDKIINSILDLNEGYDYVVQVSHWRPSDLYPHVKNVFFIEREGVILATAKDVKNVSVK